MKILGIDYGDKRIGFALSDPLEILASPLMVYNNKTMRESIDFTAALVLEKQAELIVLGLPLNMDGTEGERASKTRAFGRNLSKVSGKEVVYIDERLTSVEAEEILINADMRREKRKKVIDALAAQIILQGYLDRVKK